MGAYKYKAFISYSHKDRAWAKWLLKRIESYSFPNHLIGSKTSIGTVPRNLKPIFRDREELSAGHNLGEKIEAALTSSKNLIIICSPNAAKSHWVNQEIIYFKRHNRDANIFSVIVEGVPYSEDPQLECFPPALKIGIDEAGEETEEPAEPLAADFRPGGDGKRLGTLKLISGMAGLGVNDLIQRDLQRARRRVMTITASAAAIVLAMGLLTFTAIDARNEAQQRRNDAEGQIEFMLTDLKDKLKGVGRLDALEIVGERAKEYYDQYPISEHDADALGRKARVFHYLGELQDQLGNLDEAERHFNVAFEITDAQLEKDPENPDRIFEHAQSEFWAGYIPFRNGAYVAAEDYFTNYRDLARRLTSIEPGNLNYTLEYSSALTNLAIVQSEQLKFNLAKENYENSIPGFKRNLEVNSGSVEAHLSLANVYAWIANIQKKQGQLDNAKENRIKQIFLINSLSKKYPKNNNVLYRQLTAILAYIRIQILLKNTDDAYQLILENLPKSKELWHLDKSNSQALKNYIYFKLSHIVALSQLNLLDEARLAIAELEMLLIRESEKTSEFTEFYNEFSKVQSEIHKYKTIQ